MLDLGSEVQWFNTYCQFRLITKNLDWLTQARKHSSVAVKVTYFLVIDLRSIIGKVYQFFCKILFYSIHLIRGELCKNTRLNDTYQPMM